MKTVQPPGKPNLFLTLLLTDFDDDDDDDKAPPLAEKVTHTKK